MVGFQRILLKLFRFVFLRKRNIDSRATLLVTDPQNVVRRLRFLETISKLLSHLEQIKLDVAEFCLFLFHCKILIVIDIPALNFLWLLKQRMFLLFTMFTNQRTTEIFTHYAMGNFLLQSVNTS